MHRKILFSFSLLTVLISTVLLLFISAYNSKVSGKYIVFNFTDSPFLFEGNLLAPLSIGVSKNPTENTNEYLLAGKIYYTDPQSNNFIIVDSTNQNNCLFKVSAKDLNSTNSPALLEFKNLSTETTYPDSLLPTSFINNPMAAQAIIIDEEVSFPGKIISSNSFVFPADCKSTQEQLAQSYNYWGNYNPYSQPISFPAKVTIE